MEEVVRSSNGRRSLLNYFSNAFAFAGISAAIFASFSAFSIHTNFKNKLSIEAANPAILAETNYGLNQFYIRQVKSPSIAAVSVAKPSSNYYDNSAQVFAFTNVGDTNNTEIEILSAIAEKRSEITKEHEGYDPDVIVMNEGLTIEATPVVSEYPVAVVKEYPKAVTPSNKYPEYSKRNKKALDAIASLLEQTDKDIKTPITVKAKLDNVKPYIVHKRIAKKPELKVIEKKEIKEIRQTTKVEEPKSKPTENVVIAKTHNDELTNLYKAHLDKVASQPDSHEPNDYSAVYKHEAIKTTNTETSQVNAEKNIQTSQTTQPVIDIMAAPVTGVPSQVIVVEPSKKIVEQAEQTESKANPQVTENRSVAAITSNSITPVIVTPVVVAPVIAPVATAQPVIIAPTSAVSKPTETAPVTKKNPSKIDDAIKSVMDEWKKDHATPDLNIKEVDTKNKCEGFGGLVTKGLVAGSIPISNAKVQILGSPEHTYFTNEYGEFCITDVKISGVLPVIVTAGTYLLRKTELLSSENTLVELVLENALYASSIYTGSKTEINNAYLYGEIENTENTEMSFQVEVIDVNTGSLNKIVYVDEHGLPNANLQFTSSKRQFVLQNAKPGTYAVNIIGADQIERATHIIHLASNEGMIRKFNTGVKTEVKAMIADGITQKGVKGLSVQILGQSKKVHTHKSGAFKFSNAYVDCKDQTYLQVEGKAIYRTRFSYTCSETTPQYYLASSAKIDEISRQAEVPLMQTHGMILGKLALNRTVKMQLIGPDELKISNEPRGYDVYFDENDGGVSKSLTHTSANERFSIIDAPTGLSYLMAFDKDGTVFYWPTLITASSVNIY